MATRSSHQYVWDMLRWRNAAEATGSRAASLLADDLFGIDGALARVTDYFKAAAAGSEVGCRLLLLLGPPSGGKSTLVIPLKRALEEYSLTDEGALYAVRGCPVHESPLHLVPQSLRAEFRTTYGADIQGDLCPSCRMRLEREFGGDFMRMPIERVFISEAGRVGIGTYAPHDPTTADLADLVGSADLSKVAEYGDEGDPRAWSWSGAICSASRGMLEMIEILKVKRGFLYVLLTLTQEKNVKVSRFPLIYVDETIVAHTNLAEHYDPSACNAYLFYASDDENAVEDREPAFAALAALSERLNHFGYLETRPPGTRFGHTQMRSIVADLKAGGRRVDEDVVSEGGDVWRAIRHFFAREAART